MEMKRYALPALLVCVLSGAHSVDAARIYTHNRGDGNGGGTFTDGGNGSAFLAGGRAVFGTAGSAIITKNQVAADSTEGVLTSSLVGASVSTFATGDDIAGPGNLIVFARTSTCGVPTNIPAHWMDLTIDTAPAPGFRTQLTSPAWSGRSIPNLTRPSSQLRLGIET